MKSARIQRDSKNLQSERHKTPVHFFEVGKCPVRFDEAQGLAGLRDAERFMDQVARLEVIMQIAFQF